MGLRLVRNAIGDAGEYSRPTALDIEREARRRLARSGYERHRSREIATGHPMPVAIRILYLQITAIALALAGLETIPDDYRSDIYWPPVAP